MRGPDPKDRPLTVRLESLPDLCGAWGKTSNGYVSWWYDQRNRVMSPMVSNYPHVAALLLDTAGHALGAGKGHGGLAKIEHALLGALHLVRKKKGEGAPE